jgi:hypothetical protein
MIATIKTQMTEHLARLNQAENQAAGSRSFFMVESEHPGMHELSLSIIDNYQADLMPHNSISLVSTTQPETDEPYIAGITTGASQEFPDSWRWSVDIVSSERRDILACEVSWGESNWQKVGRHMQARLWRDASVYAGDTARPGYVYRSVHAEWHYLKPDQQGRLWRKAFIEDKKGVLANLIERGVASSDMAERAEKLRADKEKVKIEEENNPPGYFAELSKVKRHWRAIGFVSLGQVGLEFAAPTNYLDRRRQTEKVVTVESLPAHMLTAIKSPALDLRTLYITRN